MILISVSLIAEFASLITKSRFLKVKSLFEIASSKVACELSLFKSRDFKYISLSFPRFSICVKSDA
ncbi:hypothetical protein GW891_02255 [bacterium]|nr:hypothetical protein [bacterium]